MPLEVIDELLNSGMEQDAVLTTASGSRTIKTIYRNKFQVARLQGLDVNSVNPYAICRTSDVSDAVKGDKIEGLEDTELYISNKENHGQGKTILQLKFD
jgi:hypothetical protein